MINDYSHNEKIDLFLGGKLSIEEQSAFIRSMETDAALAEIVKTQKVANEIIRTKQFLRLKEKMEADLSSEGGFSMFSRFLLLSLALLTVGAGIYWYFSVKENVANTYLSNAPITNTDTTSFSNSGILPTATEHKLNKKNVQTEKLLIKDSIQKADLPIDDLPVLSTTAIDKQKTILDPVVVSATSTDKKGVDCSSFTLLNAIRTSASCQEEPTGKISIDVSEIKGGVSPYLISVSAIAPSFKDKTDFLYVKSGNYTVSVKDKNECLAIKEIEVEERECAKANVFVFTPEFEKWKIPVKQKKYGTIKIFNKSGILVYLSEVSYEVENYWDGISSGGQPLDAGYYAYTINYTNGEQESGSVSIMR